MAVLLERVTWRKPRQLTAGAPTPDLTADEAANARRALRVLRTRHGGTRALADAIGVRVATVENGMKPRRKVSVGLALRLARLAGVPLEDVLSGMWPKAGSCPHCGRCSSD
jgi:DNA-binding XRE family transcriptional regulator